MGIRGRLFLRFDRFKASADRMGLLYGGIGGITAMADGQGDISIIPSGKRIPKFIIMAKEVFTVLAGAFHNITSLCFYDINYIINYII